MEKIEDTSLGQITSNSINSSFPSNANQALLLGNNVAASSAVAAVHTATSTNTAPTNADASSVVNNQRAAYTIPGVLHFLQHEWARFEYDRQQWEAERHELLVSFISPQHEA
jgi:hypothetical protein